MSAPSCYYSLVRYCPSLTRGEQINVGIVLCCPERQYVAVETVKEFKRRPLPSVFPTADTLFLKHRLAELRRLLNPSSSSKVQLQRGLYALTGGTVPEAELFGPAVLTLLQATHCNDIQFGLPTLAAGEPHEVLKVLFHALVDVATPVDRYPTRAVIRNGFRNRLKEKKLLERVHEDILAGLPSLEEKVDFGYTNGCPHYLQAISLEAPDALSHVQRFRQLARDLRSTQIRTKTEDVELFAILHIPKSRKAGDMARALESDKIYPINWNDTGSLLQKMTQDLLPHLEQG